jgi:hypothetical protein
MTTIYLVVASGGAYEDHWERNIGARYTRENADALMEACIASNARLVEVYPAVHEAFWNVLRPAAVAPMPPKPQFGSVLTPEDRVDYDMKIARWQLACQSITELNNQQHRDTVARAGPAARQEGRARGLTEGDLESIFFDDYPRFEDATFDVEELDIQ